MQIRQIVSGYGLLPAVTWMCMSLCVFTTRNTKSMTVTKRGNDIQGRLCVCFNVDAAAVWLAGYFCVWRSVKYHSSYLMYFASLLLNAGKVPSRIFTIALFIVLFSIAPELNFTVFLFSFSICIFMIWSASHTIARLGL